MRVVHLTPELPRWPGGNGGQTRQFHLLRRLAERGDEVTVVAPVPHGVEGSGDLERAGIRLRGVARPPSRVSETLAAIARRPALLPQAATRPVFAWQVSVMWRALEAEARAAIAAHDPDVVTIEHDHAAAWLRAVPAGTPAVLCTQNVGGSYYRARAAARAGGAAALAAESRRFDRFDRRWLPRYRAAVAVSDGDAEGLRALGARAVAVVPNGVATEELVPAPDPEPGGPPRLVFTGTLDHPPNREGILWFAREVWPAVRAARADAELLVVGRSAPPDVVALGERDGIEIVGAVPAVGPWIARADLVVVPLLSGGGTRLKILEAMACERAVLSTSVGAEGLAVESSRELVLADGAERFAAATIELLADAELRGRLATAGRDLAVARYDWRQLGDRLAAALTAAAG